MLANLDNLLLLQSTEKDILDYANATLEYTKLIYEGLMNNSTAIDSSI
jgi:hypothetical protein